MATDAEIEAAAREHHICEHMRAGLSREQAISSWANASRASGGRILEEISDMRAALDAAASVRAEAGTEGMEIIRAVAGMYLWRDTYPDGPDRPITGSPQCYGLTPVHVRQARAIVAADAPSPQPPAPAEGGTDVAATRKRVSDGFGADHFEASDLFSLLDAQAAEISTYREMEKRAAAAMAAKEAEIERVRSAERAADSSARAAWKVTQMRAERIAALEAALRELVDTQAAYIEALPGERGMSALTRARSALSGKEPQQS